MVFSANPSSASVTRPRCSARALREFLGGERVAVRETRAVSEEARAPHRDVLTVADVVEERRARCVDQADSAAHEKQWAGIRIAATLRARDVDDDAYARLEELLGRYAVEVLVVDDCDVIRPEPAHEVLRAPAKPRAAGELDETHCSCTAEMNCSPPSIRRTSSRRSSSSSGSIVVCVGSPATFSTRKCRSARVAIWGRCVIVMT